MCQMLMKKAYSDPMEEQEMKMVSVLAAGAVMGRGEDILDQIMMTGHRQCQAIQTVSLWCGVKCVYD